SLFQGCRENRNHVAVHERLATREVIVADAELARFAQTRFDLGQREYSVRAIGRRGGHETMRALDIAERAGDLKPERVERPHLHVRVRGHLAGESTPDDRMPPGCASTSRAKSENSEAYSCIFPAAKSTSWFRR